MNLSEWVDAGFAAVPKCFTKKSSVRVTRIVATLSGHHLGQLNDGVGNSGSKVLLFFLPPPYTVVYRLPPRVTVASTNNNFNFAYRTLSVNSNFVTSLPQDEVRPKDRWLATVSTNSFRTRSIPNRPELPPGGKKLTIMTANQYHCQGSPRAWQHQPQSKSLYCNASIPLLPLPTIYHPVPPFQTLDTVEVKR